MTGDNRGGLALWKLSFGDSSTVRSEFDPISNGATLQAFTTVGDLGGHDAQRTECIRSLEFLPSGEHLVVSTNERLLLVLIPTPANHMKFRADMKNGIYTTVSNFNKATTTTVVDSGRSVIDQSTPFVSSSSSASPSATRPTVTLTPYAGLVIKSKRPDGHKVFINVTHHESLPAYFPPHISPRYAPPPHIQEQCDETQKSSVAVLSSFDDNHNSNDNLASGITSSVPTNDSVWTTPLSSVLSLLVSRDKSIQDPNALPRPFLAISEEGESEDNNGASSFVYTVVVSTLLYSKLDSGAVREVL